VSVKSRTIDNLGVDASVRYAQDQALLETSFIDESNLVSQQTAITVSTPSPPSSEFDEQYAVESPQGYWAVFLPPESSPKGGSLAPFSYELAPSLGGYEKTEASADKLEKLDLLQEDPEKKASREENERKKLLHFFQCFNKLNTDLSLINSRRNQYQRG